MSATRCHQRKETEITEVNPFHLRRVYRSYIISSPTGRSRSLHVLSWISTMQSGNSMQLSYWGFVETANDAMALIQPCSQGSLHFANRRPTASERPAVAQSGHIYIYVENPSTVQRWTDDQRWSRSRMLGDFLVYAELESTQMQSPRAEDGDRPRPGQTGEENWHRRLCGSLARSVKVTPQTLIKKTFSIKGSSATWRLVSYYRLIDVIEGRLPAPLVIQTWGPRAPL